MMIKPGKPYIKGNLVSALFSFSSVLLTKAHNVLIGWQDNLRKSEEPKSLRRLPMVLNLDDLGSLA